MEKLAEKFHIVWSFLGYACAIATALIGALPRYAGYTMVYFGEHAASIGSMSTIVMLLSTILFNYRRDRREERLLALRSEALKNDHECDTD